MNAVVLENVTVAYGRVPALQAFSGVFARNSLTAIVGPNGAGKSTLLKAIAGLLRLQDGRILVDRERLAYLPQAAEIQRDLPLTCAELVALGNWRRRGNARAITAADRRAVADAFAEVGLSGFEQRPLSALSAGQFQRLLFARLCVQDAEVLLLDEPFNAVDADTVSQLLDLILRRHRAGCTILCVLHDAQKVREAFPHCLALGGTRPAWGATAEILPAAASGLWGVVQ